MGRPSLLAWLSGAIFALFFLAGCEREAPPQLLGLTDLVPREVELGDRLELSGNGFPQGRVAEVRFHGVLKRPGEPPENGAELSAEGTVTSGESIELRYDDALEARFCQSGDRRAHTTFVGDVEAAFPAAAPGAPPLTATLHGVHLDLRPPRVQHEGDDREGERALAFLGLRMEARAALGGGLVVASVDPGSRADEIDVRAGDVLTSFDGLRVGELADAIPAPHTSRVTLGVRRPGAADEELRAVSLVGFRPAASESLLPGAVLLAAALSLMLLFAVPPGPRRAWIEARLVRAHARDPWVLAWPRAPRARRLHLFAVVGIGAVAAALPFTGFRPLAELDLGTAAGPLATALVVVALLTGRGEKGLSARLSSALAALSLDLVAALGFAAAVLASGSLRLHDLVRAQGAAPWAWNAFRTPTMLLAVVLTLVALASQRLPVSTGKVSEAEAPPKTTDAPSAAFALVEWIHLGVGSVLVATAFFGGFRALPVAGHDLRFAREMIGGLLLLAKSGAVAWVVLRLRAALPPSPRRTVLALAWRRLLPLAALALLGTHLVVASSLPHRVELLVGGVTLAAVVAAWVYLVRRARVPEARLALDPFL